MALSIKNDEVDRLVDEIVRQTGETKTEAIRKALSERRARLSLQTGGGDRKERLASFLRDLWATIPESELGRRLTRDEEDEILGYGEPGA